MNAPQTPALTVDIIISSSRQGGDVIVLIERCHPPPGWALPGGFVDVGETVEQAAVREAREETGLAVSLTGLLGVYSDPHRDARQHTVSVVFVAQAEGTPEGADDAKNAQWLALDQLPSLAFDHARIIEDYRDWRAARRTLAPVTQGGPD